MSEQEKQESQKTVVAFIAGLLIGGLLVWVFSAAPEDHKTKDAGREDHDKEVSEEINTSEGDDTTPDDSAQNTSAETTTPPELPIGNGDASVSNQPAGMRVSLSGATFPSDEGWIGVRDYTGGQMTGLLGVVRYSQEQGLVPQEIVLQRATTPGNTYAVVFYSENGDRIFNLAEDVLVSGAVETFQAQ